MSQLAKNERLRSRRVGSEKGVGMNSGLRHIVVSTVTLLLLMTYAGATGLDDVVSSVVEDNTSEWSPVKVLHVYVCEGYDEVQEVLRIAGASALFDVTEVSLPDFNGGKPADLFQHDVVTFGLGDCYDRGLNIGRISEMRSYVENGGGVVWTHDTLEWPQYYGPDAELPAGMVYTGPTTLRLMYEAEAVLDHEVLHVPFEIGNVGDVIPIQETHENGGVVTTADVILKFSKMNGGGKNHYLTTHEWMGGRVVVDEIGHKIFDCDQNFLGWPSVTESRIFANAICWAGKCDLTQAPQADAGPDQIVNEGDTVSLDGSGSEGNAHISSFEWDFTSDGIYDYQETLASAPDGSFDGETTYVYGDDGVYTATLKVIDESGANDTDTCNITVKNVNPAIRPFGPLEVNEGDPLTILGNATDPGSDDLTFTWEWEYGPTETTTYFNNGGEPDPPTSPDGSYPFTASDSSTYTYGDDCDCTVTLTVEDDDGGTATYTTTVIVLNVPPSLIGDIQAYAKGDLTLRIAGEKWHDVRLGLFEDGNEVGSVSVVRCPGSPDDQSVTLENVTIDLINHDLTAVVEYTPMDDPVNGRAWGSTPAWLIFRPQGSAEEVRLHHTFNVRHPDTWIWTVDDFDAFLVGADITFEATAADPGSDDITFEWNWGDGSITSTDYYNDGMGHDLYPSPDVNPITVADVQQHTYFAAGTYTIALKVKDDDGGAVSISFALTV